MRLQRARAATKASSSKRQQALNKRRTGLPQTTREVPVQLRRPKTKLTLRAARKAAAAPVLAAKTRQQKRRATAATVPTLDVSNIQRHFATYPTKFDLPKGTNLRITIKCVACERLGGVRSGCGVRWA